MSALEQYDDIEAALMGDEPDWDTEPIPAAGMDHADRMLRRLARLQREQRAAEDLANTERERINTWLAGEQVRILKQQVWLEQSLAQFHRAALTRDPKAKTITLPNGVLKARAQQPEWTFDDPDGFLTWAQENAPELVRQPDPPPPAIDKAATKKAMGGNVVDGQLVVYGEIVPGVTVVERDPKFVAEVSP